MASQELEYLEGLQPLTPEKVAEIRADAIKSLNEAESILEAVGYELLALNIDGSNVDLARSAVIHASGDVEKNKARIPHE
jgi:hypothetical protein